MDGNEIIYDWKPCAKCQKRKKKCPHEGEWVPRVSQETACVECRRLKIKCTHQKPAGSSTPAAAAGKPKPVRGLTAPEREAAEAFMAPDPVGRVVEYEVMYFDEKDVSGHNPELR